LVSIEPEGQESDRKDLAEILRELRRVAGLSGERLAARCAMSQSRISRIESGKVLPAVADVQRILTALQVPAEQATELLSLARIANVEYRSSRAFARLGTWRRQLELKALTEATKVLRQFLPAMPTGLIQIPEYAAFAMASTVPSEPERDVTKSVHARMELQKVLDDHSRKYVLLMTEQAVRWNYAGPEIMAKQVAHMARVVERPNVEIAILPLSVEVHDAPINIFTIHDDRLVTVELFNGGASFRDPRDVMYYLELFEFFLGHALTGDAAVGFLRSVASEFM
jgi:transcriptional regulator with XRE-family HTH domain